MFTQGRLAMPILRHGEWGRTTSFSARLSEADAVAERRIAAAFTAAQSRFGLSDADIATILADSVCDVVSYH